MTKKPARCEAIAVTSGTRCKKPQSSRWAPCCTAHREQWIALSMKRSQTFPGTFPGKVKRQKHSQKKLPGTLKGSGNLGTSGNNAHSQERSQTDDQPRQAQRRGLACLGRIVLPRGNMGL